MKKLVKEKYLIGVDEVGRGPIAGPVAVGAFVFLDHDAPKLFRGVKDSKQLTEAGREKWFSKIQKAQAVGRVAFHVSFESEKIIDCRGLTYAIKKALANSLKNLDITPASARVLLDGGLKAPAVYKDQQTVIRGDEKLKVIALASICAKVLRDRKMVTLSKKHPGYGFEEHKGYGTRNHYEAVNSQGILACHRKSFLGIKTR